MLLLHTRPMFYSKGLRQLLNLWPGKRLGVYRFLPLFFVVGASIEWVMINARIAPGRETFCKSLRMMMIVCMWCVIHEHAETGYKRRRALYCNLLSCKTCNANVMGMARLLFIANYVLAVECCISTDTRLGDLERGFFWGRGKGILPICDIDTVNH